MDREATKCPMCGGDEVITPEVQDEFCLDEICPLCEGTGYVEDDHEDAD